MPDYLSPGVYVEEYESGARPVSGVSTSIPGFLGLAEKGGSRGLPQLVTNAADFQRKYGGYLPRSFGDYRFLRYAVEQFFINGGSLCYVMRVKLEGSEPASRVVSFSHSFRGVVISSNENASDGFNITMTPARKDGTPLTKDTSGDYVCTSDLKLSPGDTVMLHAVPPPAKSTNSSNNADSAPGAITAFLTVASYAALKVTFTDPLPDNIEKCFTGGVVTIRDSGFTMNLGKGFPKLENLSFNRRADSYFAKKCNAVSNLPFIVTQESVPDDSSKLFDWIMSGAVHEIEFKSGGPYIKLTAASEGGWGNKISAVFEGGSTIKAPLGEFSAGTQLASCTTNAAANFRAGDIAALVPAGQNSNDVCNTGTLYAIVEGVDGNTVFFKKAVSLPVSAAYFLHLCDLRIKISCGETEEVYEQVTMNAASPDYIGKRLAKSELIQAETNNAQITETRSDILAHPFSLMFPYNTGTKQEFTLEGGKDGVLSDDMSQAFIGEGSVPGGKTGLAAYSDNNNISILCAPGVTDVKIQSALVLQCENLQNRFAVLDAPGGARSVDALTEHREKIESSYAALYHPWLEGFDYLDKVNIYLPPSGAAAGIYARVDQSRGVHKAPANEPVKGITGLSCVYGKGEQSILNPKGVNLIMPFTGQGIRIWGARTCSSNSLWRYVNVRRLFIYISESIKLSTNWVVFEPNDRFLWLRVQRMISEFLEGLWRDGALFGASKEEAFFVEIGETTMTQDDIDNGRLICRIGVAPVKPAEFVIFRITQKTQD